MLLYFGLIVVLFFGVRLALYLLLQLFTGLNALLQEVSETHLDEHACLSAILTVAVAHSEEVLMERLTNVRRQDEIVLVLLVHVVD